MSDLLNTRQLAAALNVSPATVSEWTRIGKIPVIVIGRTRRYLLSEVVSSASVGVRPGVQQTGQDARKRAQKLRRQRLGLMA